MSEREAMEVDVVIVGAGPAGLSAAIRLKQLALAAGEDLSIVVVEKAAAIGAHILSGAVIDPSALNALFPDWKERGAPLRVPVRTDAFSFLTALRGFAIPSILLPPLLSNHGNYIVSLGEVCRWLAEQAEVMGIDVFPGFAASEVLYNKDGVIKGIATGDMGVDRDGQPKSTYAPGMELHARYTLIAEGARGSLARQIIDTFALDADCEPQKYGIGIKEVWEVDPKVHREGHVEHTLGWPLSHDTGGGGFVYHAADSKLYVGFVVHLNYRNPHLSPFEEMQRYKTHPRIRPLLENGRRIAFGARAMTSGGWQSIPKLAFPGGALIGCAAGFMNVPRIKGTHNAMWSAMKAAEDVFVALQDGRGNDVITSLDGKVRDQGAADLKPVRNVKPLLGRFGTPIATMMSGLDMWVYTLLGLSLFGTLRHSGADHATLDRADESRRIVYPRSDGKITFDRLSSVYLSNLSHDEDQPVHLRLADPGVPVRDNLPLYDEPAQRYCPAGVYEIATDAGEPSFRINAANCVHCKTCDIKDPQQNITWVPPEGGSGPNYNAM